jgi:arginyl-tRNA synthetase
VFNQFYHDIQVLKETDEQKKQFRLALLASTASVIKNAMDLLGIEVPERM